MAVALGDPVDVAVAVGLADGVPVALAAGVPVAVAVGVPLGHAPPVTESVSIRHPGADVASSVPIRKRSLIV